MAKLFYSLTITVMGVLCVTAWEPPKLPAGRRLQYYILHPQGDYVYGYDTGEGTSHAARSDNVNRVRGHFQYGNNAAPGSFEYSYTGGFASPETAIDSGAVGIKSTFGSGNVQSYDSGPSDASYSFSYNAGDHSRQESSDPAGNVKGSYAFTAKDGIDRKVDYEAGAEKGFVAKGAHLPVAPESLLSSISKTNYGFSSTGGADGASNLGSYQGKSSDVDGSYSFSYNAGDHYRLESADTSGNVKGQFGFVANDGLQRKVEYVAGAEKGFVAKGAHLPQPADTSLSQPIPISTYNTPQANIDSSSIADGSYSFSYNAGDHSRQESSDPAGNVRGHFSFTAKDGVNREVNYEAGAGKGFIAKGAHLPIAPEPLPIVGSIATPNIYFAPKPVIPITSSSSVGADTSDGSYSFSYNAGDHARQESADSAGNVRGQFSFLAKDGVNRQVNYEAGAERGFIAKGAHLPVAPKAQSSVSSTSTQTSHYSIKPVIPISGGINVDNSATDGSYSFSYNAGDHSRQESADSVGNVRGQYSFIAKDGVNRKVDYEAGAEKGFLAKGAHLPVGPEAPSFVSSVATPSSYYSPKQVTPISSTANADYGAGDGSYSFSYNAGDHSRQESADSTGNVRGQFSFVAKDGVNRKVDYEAGAEKGFIAKGAHIPVDVSSAQKSSIQSTGSLASQSYFQSGPALSLPSLTSTNPIDGSYSFSYDATDHAREESADASGNVKGNFRFVAKDGVNRKVEYEAGAEKGFIAKGDHLPAPALIGGAGDLAYKYSYETDTSKKTEASDANGNIFGSYSYLGADGLTRTVNYRAGGEEGFVSTGDNLEPSAKLSSSISSSTSSFSSSSHPSSLAGLNVGAFKASFPSNFHSFSSKSSNYKPNTKAATPFTLHTFLPHESPNKFGYVYDTAV